MYVGDEVLEIVFVIVALGILYLRVIRNFWNEYFYLVIFLSVFEEVWSKEVKIMVFEKFSFGLDLLWMIKKFWGCTE